jgi:DNA end-binding protein Ku
MRSVWNGEIGFGDSTIPVRAYPATERRESGLRQVHVTDGGRVRHRNVCEVDDEPLTAEEIGHGYELPGGAVVLVTDEELASLPAPPSTRRMDIAGFVALEQIDPIFFARSYHLAPDPVGTKAYVLLAEALHRTGRVALGRIALRGKESPALLRVRDQVLVLETLLWPSEVRVPDFPFQHEDTDLRLPEIRDAVALVEQLSTDFSPATYTDERAKALDDLIAAKVERDEVLQPTAPAQNQRADEVLGALRQRAEPDEAVQRATSAAQDAADARDRARSASRRRSRQR